MKQKYMKRSVLLALAFFILLTSCHLHKKNTDAQEESAGNNSALIGAYKGTLQNDTLFELFISKVAKDSIVGSIVIDEGFVNSFIIPMAQDGNYKITVKSPYDNRYNGAYTFSIPDNSADNITGTWQSDSAGAAPESYQLQRKKFTYQPDAGSYSEASEKILKQSDISIYAASELNQMRNEIYARHGYCFKNKEQREFFEMQEWYVPFSIDVKNSLTDIEKKNIPLIMKQEKYASTHDEDFGR
jgi:hypothetical protein